MSQEEEYIQDDPIDSDGSQEQDFSSFEDTRRKDPIEGVELEDVEDPNKEYRLKIRNANYIKGDDGRYLINGKWYTMTQAIAREKRIKNLKPFEPDNKWSVRRREKLTSKQILETLMDMRIKGVDINEIEGYFSVGELMHTRMVELALRGNINAYKEILDRMEGKPMTKTTNSGEADESFSSKRLSDLVAFKTIEAKEVKGGDDEE